ncbi:MAG: GlsB/YeaQ/YmgE family stress response membrane protein [Actinomycetota bacterium]|nr:GlsB/YeaQ/YmgE family stress response membrane protein [Actinomycetota bacterium]
MWNIIAWIILGLIAGAIAKLIMPGNDPGGIIVTILLGIVGALLGGWLASLVGQGTGGPLSISSIIAAIVGALILLAIYRVVVGRRAVSR